MGKFIKEMIKKIKERCISDNLYYFLLCSLLECSDKVANTASVYGAYLKNLKKSAQKQLVLEGAEYELNDNVHQVFRKDANELIKEIEGDILYLAPPYNSSQYGHYDLAQTDYQRFKADSNRFNKADSTVEYLHILEKR